MPKFGQERDIPNFGGIPLDGDGNTTADGIFCYSQDIIFRVGLTQGYSRFDASFCEQQWRFTANVGTPKVSFLPGHTCDTDNQGQSDEVIVSPCPYKVTLTDKFFKGRNAYGPPFNYDDYSSKADWIRALCKKKVKDDPDVGAGEFWDFQYEGKMTIQGCSETNPHTTTSTSTIFPPNPINPATGNPGAWKWDTDCSPDLFGDQRRREEVERVQSCFCKLLKKLDDGDMTQEEFDICFKNIIQQYLYAMMFRINNNIYTGQYDPNDPDTWNEAPNNTTYGPEPYPGCPDCVE
jgi:hypothetical protein